MNRQLQWTNSGNEQTAAMNKQLQWTNNCNEQRTTVNSCSCLFTAVGWTGSNSWQAVQGCTTWMCRMCICGLIMNSRYCKCKWGALTMYNFLYTDWITTGNCSSRSSPSPFITSTTTLPQWLRGLYTAWSVVYALSDVATQRDCLYGNVCVHELLIDIVVCFPHIGFNGVYFHLCWKGVMCMLDMNTQLATATYPYCWKPIGCTCL